MSVGNGSGGGVNTVSVQRFPTSPTRTSVDIHRTPPYSEEAEKGVLGSMLISPREAISECAEKISEAHFYVPSHQTIYNILIELWEKGQAIDLITFTQILRDRNFLEPIGGAAFITALFLFVPTAANLGYYLEILRDKFIAREIITKCTELVRIAYEEQDEINLVLDQAQSALTALGLATTNVESLRHIRAGVETTMEKFETAHAHRGDTVISGLATGFHDLDRMLSGLKPQQLITIAGLTSHGKTALATNIAEDVAMRQGEGVGIWSMEMSYDEQSERLVCAVADVSLQRLRDGFLGKEDFGMIAERVGPLVGSPLYIDDTRGLSINDFKARLRRAVLSKKIGLAIADYGQLMNSPTRRGQENRAREIDEIWGGFKSIAKELRIPVIALAQLNRDADKSAGKFPRPKLSNLKESSSIEQHSDVVIFVRRPIRFIDLDDEDGMKDLAKRFHLEELNKKYEIAWRRQEEVDGEAIKYVPLTAKNYAELIVAKQRNGPVGEVRLRYEGDVTRFENVTPKMWSNKPEERQR